MKQSTWKQNTQKISVLLFGLTLLLLSAASISFAQDITLAWDANQESDVAFYNINFRDVETQSTWQEPGPVHDPSTSVVSHQILGLDRTRQHCFTVTALNDSGVESSPSEEVCTTAAPAAIVLAPNGGESLAGLTTTNIQWTSHPDAGSYWVRFSSDGGTSWSRLTTQDAALPTSYSWLIPNNINSANCLINVIAFNGAGQWLATDSSDAVFSITPAVITVLAPNGGEPLAGLSTTNIEWTAYPDAASYWVRFSSDGGTSWSRLATQAAALGTNYSWSIPNNIDSVECLINVIAFNGAGQWLASYSSDGVFTVAPVP